MPSYSSLTPAQKIQYAKDVSMANNGVTQPNTTAINIVNLDKLITSTSVDINATKQLLGSLQLTSGASPYTYPVPFSSLPGEVQSKLKQFIPPGYTPPTTITGQELIDIEQGVLNSLQELKANPATLPKAGIGTVPAVQPAAIPATTLPTNTTPASTTAPSINTSNSTISNVLTAAAVIGGGALVVNALNNRVQNATPAPTTPTTPAPIVPAVENATTPATGQNAATNAAFLDANAEPQQLVDPNTDPNTNIGNDSQTPAPQPQQTITLASDPNTNIGAEAQIQTPQPINPNSDPNTNIGTEAQDLVYDPLQEPPITNDGDEFSGIDEQVQRQKDLEDGSLEFAGIDDQIAANENALQEPPLLSDEEVEQQLGLAAAQEETITLQKVPDEFDGIDAQVAANKAQADLDAQDAAVGGGGKGISTALNDTRSTATKDDSANFQQKPDWRARLSLSPGANYLYKVPAGQAGILAPLQSTDGVIFPYTPAISVTYSAGYDASDLIHSNYKVYQYKGSSVDTVSITADFTAQDTTEANYLLAVIHFFRSVTKMFYGQDKNPNNGVPPPLCYLSGFGAYTFDAHPLVVTNFTYTTPTEVDYIRAGSQTNQPGVNISQQKPVLNSFVPPVVRVAMNGLAPKVPNFTTQNTMINSEATYIPTKIQLQITCIPIVTRNDISNKFSLKEYATGALLRGSKRSGGGIW